MKKFCLFAFFLLSCAALFAADIDGAVKSAIDAFALKVVRPLEVSVGDINLAGTQSPSALSRSLSIRIADFAPRTGKFTVKAPTRGISRVNSQETGVIKGVFIQEGDTVRVTLQLVMEPSGEIIDSRSFNIPVADLKKIGVEILPDNIKTVEEIKVKEEIINPPAPPPAPPVPVTNVPPPSPPAPATGFTIQAWPNSDTRTYFEGDTMTVQLFASQNCYVKVYHFDVEGKQMLLFPNQYNRDNFLKANTEYTIPQSPVNIIVEKPFGLENVLVMASAAPFAIAESEFAEVKNASPETVAAARATARGVRLEVKPGDGYAETRFSITTLPANYSDASYSYPKPANMAETVRSMRDEAQRQGGSFNGNEREGSFSMSGTAGSYRVSGNTVTVNVRYTGNQISAALNRGAGSSFNFSIDRPRNINAAVQAVRSGIEGKGGTFSGNEQQGNFRASGIAGQYNVSDHVSVSINEKPILIPNTLIEKEVKSYFNGK